VYLDHHVQGFQERYYLPPRGKGSSVIVFRLFLMAVKRLLPLYFVIQKQTTNTAEMGGTINTLRTPTSGDAKSFASRAICQPAGKIWRISDVESSKLHNELPLTLS
jgi:hypothetical protein